MTSAKYRSVSIRLNEDFDDSAESPNVPLLIFQISLTRLASSAKARFVLASATDLDLENNEIIVTPTQELPRTPIGRSPSSGGAAPLRIHFDILSLNIGSASKRCSEIPGVLENAITTRPIHDFVYKVLVFERAFFQRQPAPQSLRLIVIGAGMAGIELLSALSSRFRSRHPNLKVEATIVSGLDLMGTLKCRSLATRVLRRFARYGVKTLFGTHVTRVEPGIVHLDNNTTEPFDLLIWCAGVDPPDFVRTIGAKGLLELEPNVSGFLKVTQTLQTTLRPDIFGEGDCVSVSGFPNIPKAGVIAVHQGPVLISNVMSSIEALQVLRNSSTGEADWAVGKLDTLKKLELKEFKPQRNCLQIINMGDEFGIGGYKNYSFEGKFAWKLKSWLDRKWIRSFPMACIKCCGTKGGDALDDEHNHNHHQLPTEGTSNDAVEIPL